MSTRVFIALLCFLAANALAIVYDTSSVDWSKVNFEYNPQGPYFVLWGSPALAQKRIDPMISPGQPVSQHLHSFAGSNVVSPSMQYSDLLSSTKCSTFKVQADRSAYWNAALFFQDPTTGAFDQVSEKTRKVYYGYKNNQNALDTTVKAFEPGFRMIAGSPSATTRDAVQDCTNTECGYHQVAEQKIVSWKCFDSTGATLQQSTGFPPGMAGCPGGLSAQIMFPNCWNGEAFNAAKPQAHVALSSNADGEDRCPSGYTRLPQMYAEVNYDVSSFQWTAADSPFVLAFGDKTGYGFHMDFTSGWVADELNKVMATCRQGDLSNPTTLSGEDCFGQVGGLWSDEEMQSCAAQESGQVKIASVNALPGCQTIHTEGSEVNLKTCADTTPTTNNGVADGVAVANKIRKRSGTTRYIAGHGRVVEIEA